MDKNNSVAWESTDSKISSVFHVLNKINVNEHTEKKGSLTYLPWAWAWARVKENYPEAYYTIYENANGMNYHTDGRTCWVKTGVTIEGLELIEYLPVMDMRNNSIPLERVDSFAVNKAIQRSLTKACARHGLGLYIYAGEDLPEDEQPEVKTEMKSREGKDYTKTQDINDVMATDKQIAYIKRLMGATEDTTGVTINGRNVEWKDLTIKEANNLITKLKG